jgi:uncharacterized OsmC-like protein
VVSRLAQRIKSSILLRSGLAQRMPHSAGLPGAPSGCAPSDDGPRAGHEQAAKEERMKREIIAETERVWQAEPDKAKGRPSVTARSEGAEAVIEAGSFTWRADLPPALGGTNRAPSPTALLLSALAGCAVAFIRDTLAPQLGVRVDSVEATARCETDSRGLLGMDGSAPDLRSVDVAIQVTSPDGEASARRLFAAWQERCPIYLALVKPTPVTTRFDVKPA